MNDSPGLKCFILDDYAGVALRMADWTRLADRVDIRSLTDPLQGDALIDAIGEADILIVMRERTPLPRAVLERLGRLKLIVTSGMRNASIDLQAARERGIVVCGTRSHSEPPTELTWALILALLRQLPLEAGNMRAGGRWQSTLGSDLAGSTIGVVGLGKVGSRVARIAHAFDMEVLAWSPNLTAERAAACQAELVSKPELFSRSDVVSLHLVLSERTEGIVGRAELDSMQPHAVLINTSRAGLVDRDALLDALRQRRIGGAGLDVFDEEPLPRDDPLRELYNVLATPHLGYVTERNYRSYFGEAVENIEAWLEGRVLRPLSVS